MLSKIRTQKTAIAFLVAAFASYAGGALLPAATGYIPAALLAAFASYAAWGTQSKTLRYVVSILAILMLVLALTMNLFVLGLSTEVQQF